MDKCQILKDAAVKVKSCLCQEGCIEELSTCFNLDTALLNSSESLLSVFAFRQWENLVSSSIYPSCAYADIID